MGKKVGSLPRRPFLLLPIGAGVGDVVGLGDADEVVLANGIDDEPRGTGCNRGYK